MFLTDFFQYSDLMKPSEISQVDLAIIGGGINGAGLAAQASHAGLSVALFEKGDFASGASSKSTKLLHGGIRYLEQYRFPLVFEGLHERHRLMNLAPHLSRAIPFLLPSYKTDQRPAWMLKIGLWLYDLLAGAQNIGRHHWFSPGEALKKAPALKKDGLKGCGLYYDAQVNDARLVLENVLAAEEKGAHCFNYCRVTQIDGGSPLARVFYRDELSNESGVITASCLVNASGPWANQTAKMLSENALKLVRPTRGTHIVLPEILPDYAVLIATPKDNRVIFVIPWRGYSLVGTTDLDDPGNPDLTHPTEEEIQYLLSEAGRVFPGYEWNRNKVIAAFAGLRPLAWADDNHASSVSREDKILRDGNRLTIVGGKLTTYHAMASKALAQVLQILQKKPGGKWHDRLPGAPDKPWGLFLKEETSKWVSKYGIKESEASHLVHLYGQKAGDVLNLLEKNPGFREPLHPERPELLAQVAYAIQNEKAIHLEDVMLRRLEIGYSRQRWGPASEKASRLMAELLGWDESVRQKELELYKQRLYPQP
jgi:glycerol-3-phosphate dehydrogenase